MCQSSLPIGVARRTGLLGEVRCARPVREDGVRNRVIRRALIRTVVIRMKRVRSDAFPLNPDEFPVGIGGDDGRRARTIAVVFGGYGHTSDAIRSILTMVVC